MYLGRQRHRGFMILVVVALIMIIALTALVTMTGELVAGAGRRLSATEGTLTRVQKALVLFASTHQRLPCPAKPSGAMNPGWPDDVSPLALPANASCAFPAGVVPWGALGLTQEDVTDEWGRLISYRVYDGQFGLTQSNGASAINCDTDNVNTQNVEPTATGLCNNQSGTHDTLRSHFITYTTFGTTPSFDKGLNLHDFGPDPNVANVPNVAFVLISHGPSGLGAYTANGTQLSGIATGARDYANTQAAPSFFIRQATSSADVSPGSAGHFDDLVGYLKIADLLTLAKQDARDWPEAEETPTLSATTTTGMTSPSTQPTTPHFMSTIGAAAGQAFSTTDTTGTAVQAGIAAGSFSACLWWPGKLTMVSGTSRKSLTTFVQFAATDNAGDPLAGFTQGFLAGTSAVTTTGSGTAGNSSIQVVSSAGIVTGMTVLGSGIATGATVTGVSGTTVSLSPANTSLVSGAITFGAPTNVTCGTSIDAVVTATGSPGNSDLIVSNTAGIEVGQSVVGNGIPFNATVSSISGSGAGATVTMNVNAIQTVAGSVQFADGRQIRRDMGWAGGTLTSYLDRFAVEFDATQDTATSGPPAVATASDPSRPHLATDLTGVVHGTDAASCVNTGTGLECDSEVSSLPTVTKAASGSGGLSVITITDPEGMYGIVHGMGVTGSGIPSFPSPTVTAISGNLVMLSRALTGSVTSATFSAISTTNLMQNGLSVFHNARIEISPRDCYSPTTTGTSGQSSVTVTDASMIQSGMAAYGRGIGVGATVAGPFQVNLSSSNAADFSESVTFTGNGSTITTNATGLSGQSNISVSNVAGITSGMVVSGNGIASGATVSSIQVNLTAANWRTVSGSVIFAGATAVSTFGTGTSGSSNISVISATGISPGMTVLGTGLAQGAKVSSVVGTNVTLSAANTGTVSGTVKFLPERTLVKGWTLSNSGCNLDAPLCAAMANISSKFTYAGSSGASTSVTGSFGSTSLTVTSATGITPGMSATATGVASGAYVTSVSGSTVTLSAANTGTVSGIARFDNRQILHTTSCVPAASVANAYDSVYFGLTTASRTTGAAVSRTGSGLTGSNQITVTSTSGISTGMSVRGVGIGNDATVTSIDSASVLTLSASNTAAVSGTVSFAGGANVVFRAINAIKTDLP